MPCSKIDTCGIGRLYQLVMEKQDDAENYQVLGDSLPLIRQYLCSNDNDSKKCPFLVNNPISSQLQDDSKGTKRGK